jgi:peptidoglycan/xylan/chitin deacetylase (PgdA/CDA1 family)
MRIPGLKSARKTAIWLKNKIFPGALILGYHRIVEAEYDSFSNCTTPGHFAQQMEVLKICANPISLDDLIGCVEVGEIPSNTVCVTIDDGYADALYNAKPILEKYEIPATVFVTTGNLGAEFWWDELERYVLSAPHDAGLLHLSKEKLNFEWDFTGMHPAYRASQVISLADFLRQLDEVSRRQLLDKIKTWSGNRDLDDLPLVRSMLPNELVSLIDGGLIQIGSHTVTHPMLSALSEGERRHEIYKSKQDLEAILAKPVTGLSYPNGTYLKSDLDLVSEAGYLYACASNNGTIRSGFNRFTLPRFWIPNTNGEKFQQWLKRW